MSVDEEKIGEPAKGAQAEMTPAGDPQDTPQGKPGGKSAKRVLLAIAALALAAVCFLAGWLGHFYSVDSRTRTLLWMIDTLQSQYYREVDLDELYDRLYDSVVPDRFSVFYTKDEYNTILMQSQGENADTGISIYASDGALRVYRVVENSPADLAGVTEGMYIYRFGADESSLASGDTAALIACVQENRSGFVLECGYTEETAVCYSLQSTSYLAAYCMYADSESSFHFRGTTQLALTETGDGMEGLDDDTAYIRLTEFDGNAELEMIACLSLMKERNRTNLVFDLRANGGGYLSTLQSIASHLMRNAEGSAPIVATAKYRSGRTTIYRAYCNDFDSYFPEGAKITVLADANTASASEALIGAMIDYGTIGYGDIYLREDEDGVARTYGKGVMQSPFTAADGSVFRLTVAEIFWPNGNSIHDVGITKEDGANAVSAPLVRGETDVFLEQVLAQL